MTFRAPTFIADPRCAAGVYGLRSNDALPLLTSKGTELCSWVICQRPSIFR